MQVYKVIPSNPNVIMVRNTLAVYGGLTVDTRDVGTLCSSPNINPWSTYKPVSVPSVVLNDATRAYVSGFKIAERVLYYDKPTGGELSPYRLGDFIGYNPVARRPSNASCQQNINEVGTTYHYGPGDAALAFNIVLPNTEVIKRFVTEQATSVNKISVFFRSASGYNGSQPYTVNSVLGSVAIVSGNLSETNYSFRIGVTLNLNTWLTGSTFTIIGDIWYGDESDPKKFQIPGGDTATITGRILPLGVIISASFTPYDHFPPNSISNYETLVPAGGSTLNGSTLTISSLRIEGSNKLTANTTDLYNFASEKGVGWVLQYQVSNNNGIKVAYTNVPAGYYSASATATQGYYYVALTTNLVLSNIAIGDTIQFRMEPIGSTFNYI